MPGLLLPSLLAASGLLLTLAAQEPALPSAAAPQAPKPAGAQKLPVVPVLPSSDPFIRNPAAQKPPKAPAVAEPAPNRTNLLATLETWSLSQADFAAILDGPAGDGAPYARLEELAKAGKATLVNVLAISSKSGQRAVLELINELPYLADATVSPEGLPSPAGWERRNTGDTLEIEMVLGSDGKTIEVNLVPQTVRFDGFKDAQSEGATIGRTPQSFQTDKVSTSMSLRSGRPAFLTTASPMVSAEIKGAPQVRIRTLRATAQPVAPAPPIAGEVLNLRVEFLLYSMDRQAARGILNNSGDSAQSYAAVRDLVGKGEAQLDLVSAFVTKSGQRGLNEDLFEFRYPSKTKADALGFPSGQALAQRNTGVTFEIEGLLGPDARFVDVTLTPKTVEVSGMHSAGGNAPESPPQPVFTTRSLTTSVSSGAGVPVLLGTFSEPRDFGVNERKDDGRTVLAYARVTPVRP